MNNSATRFGIVSLGAAAAALPAGQGLAQDGASALDGYKFSLQGGAANSAFMANAFEEKGGGDFPENNGLYGSVAISRAISDKWDWRVSTSVLAMGDARITEGGGTIEVSLSMEYDGLTTAADFGRNFTLGKTRVRLGAGLLAAKYSDATEFSFYDSGSDKGVLFGVDQTYQGVGPMISADLSHPVSKDGRLSAIGGASLAKTFGDFGGRAYLEAPPDPTIDKYGSVDGSAIISSVYLGLSYQKTDSLSLSLGLRHDRFKGSIDGNGDGFGITGDDAVTNTVFAGMSIQF